MLPTPRPWDVLGSESKLEGLPGPVASDFRGAVVPGTPLAVSARIVMDGRIKIGRRVPGVEWSTNGSDRLCARYRIADYPLQVDFSLQTGGRIRAVTLERWGDPDGTGRFGVHAFGGVQ